MLGVLLVGYSALLLTACTSGAATTGRGLPTAETAPSDFQVALRRGVDPEPAPPPVYVVGDGARNSGFLYVYEWLIDGELRHQKPSPTVAWPHPIRSAEGPNVLIMSRAEPEHLEVRFYEGAAVDPKGAPSGDPVQTLVCRRSPEFAYQDCIQGAPGAYVVTPAPLPPGMYHVAIFASWLPPADYWVRMNAASDPGELYATWLASVSIAPG